MLWLFQRLRLLCKEPNVHDIVQRRVSYIRRCCCVLSWPLLTVPMRRAAVQAFRTARRPSVRIFPGRTPTTLIRNHGLVPRSRSIAQTRGAFQPTALQASMIFRNYFLAFVSTLVASGAWYAYKEKSPEASSTSVGVNTTTPIAFQLQGTGLKEVNPTGINGQPSSLNPENPFPPSITQAPVVSSEQLYAGVAEDKQPVSKSTEGSERKSVGMLTPEEATRKLRKNEESYFVGRGRGVVRYDVVQLPSNDPIEDDHAEKIIEVPGSIVGASGEHSSDWMFWGVFDGHS